MPKNIDCEEYQSGETNYKPYSLILDDYKLRSLKKPKDDIEFAIGKMINYMSKFLLNYRTLSLQKKYKAKLLHKQKDELKTKTLKIRDKESTFRAEIKFLVEETSLD